MKGASMWLLEQLEIVNRAPSTGTNNLKKMGVLDYAVSRETGCPLTTGLLDQRWSGVNSSLVNEGRVGVHARALLEQIKLVYQSV